MTVWPRRAMAKRVRGWRMRARVRGGARGGGVAGCGAGLRGGEGAGLPKLEELFQAAEDAGEGGQNQGVQNLRQPAPNGATCRVVAQAGEMVGQRRESV